MKVGIIGPTSQLGTDLHLLLPNADLLFKSKLNFLNPIGPTGIQKVLSEGTWDYLINCAAITDVNYCEEHPDEAALIHATSVGELAEVCDKRNIHLIHISTDFVFDGEAGFYSDSDLHYRPINVYGATKLAGEMEIIKRMPGKNFSIIRTSSLFGSAQGRKNFVTRIIEAGIKKNEIKANPERLFSPTSTRSFSKKIVDKMKEGMERGEILHSVCGKGDSQVNIASFIFKNIPALNHVKVIESKQKTKPARPKNSTLLASEGWELQDWKVEIYDFLLNKGYARPACVIEVENDAAYSVSKIWEKLGYREPNYIELVKALRDNRSNFLLGKKSPKGSKKSIMDMFKEVKL